MTKLLGNVAAVVLYVIFLNIFLFHSFGPVAFFLYIVGSLVLLISLFLKPEHLRNQWYPAAIGTLYILTNGVVVLSRGNAFVQVFAALNALGGLVAVWYLLSTSIPFFRSLSEFVLSPLMLGISYLVSAFELLMRIKSEPKHFTRSEKITRVIKSAVIGGLLAIPVLFILVGLFSGADPIFSKYIESFWKISFSQRLQGRIIFSLFWIAVLLPLIAFIRKREHFSPLTQLYRLSFIHEISVVMGLACATIGLFLIVQWPYVFANVAAETDLSKFGVATYSEYVKRGFGQFLIVSFFIYTLLWAGLITLRSRKQNQKTVLPALQYIMLFEYAVLIISIFRRIWLYYSLHGLSLVRIYGAVFLIWVSAMAAILFLRHLLSKKWVVAEVGVMVLAVMFFGFFNAEAFIAAHRPPTVNHRVDYTYLVRMSPDGYAGWHKAFTFANDTLNTSLSQTSLNADQRREVALSGFIIGRLLLNAQHLTSFYGTSDEQKIFEITNLRYQKNLDIRVSAEIEAKYNSLTAPSATVSAQFSNLQKQMTAHTQKIDELESQISTETGNIASHFHPINGYFPQQEGIFQRCDSIAAKVDAITSSTGYTNESCLENFYANSITDEATWFTRSKNFEQLDKIFSWNGSQAKVYQQMKTEIPQTDLLNLMSTYFLVSEKISQQPPDERRFWVDMSFDAPFLDSF